MRRFLTPLLTTILLSIISLSATAQTTKSYWQRHTTESQLDLELFRALQVANFPTAETLQKGDLEFEISHRFAPPPL